MRYSLLLTIGGILGSVAAINLAQISACCTAGDPDGDGDGYCSSTDCDDNDPDVNPDAVEVCDEKDNNCNGVIDSDAEDADGDAYSICSDCNDSDPNVNPGAGEMCNNQDDNCDDVIPAAEKDADRDDYAVCEADCDDADPSTYPTAAERCDGVDNDCDGTLPTNESDSDGDSYSVCAGDCDDRDVASHPGATELCDGVDQDCDGLADASVDATSGWERSVCGAVISPTAGSFDSKGADQGVVIFNEDLALYQMWYRSTDNNNVNGIAYATSIDGANWTKYTQNVLKVGASGGWDGNKIGFPAVIYVDGSYHMWYQGQDTSNYIRIGYATSTDGVTWTKYQSNPVLNLGATGTWDSKVVQAPSVRFDDATSLFQMWYTGSDGTYLQTGYAFSDDGISWTKAAENPVLRVGAAGEWDSKRAVFAHVHKYNGIYQMWYSGDDTSNTYTYEIGYASSADPVSWTKLSTNPVLSFGAPGSFDAYMVYAADVLPVSDGYSMFYSGGAATSGPYAIGIARNSEPTVTSLRPMSGTVGRYGDVIDFGVLADDDARLDSLTALWFSSIDGFLGAGSSDASGQIEFSTSGLSKGIHRITVAVRDGGGITSLETAELAVE